MSVSLRWFVARIAGSLLTLLGAALVVFIVLRTIPGDAITAALGIESGALTADQYAALANYYGVDKPWIEQLVDWIGQLLQGNLGVSLTSGQSVASLIGAALPVTIQLATMATLIGAVAGIALGVFAASRPDRARDSITQGAGLLGLAIPEFVLGTVVVAMLAEMFGYFPDTGTYVSPAQSISGNLSQMLYPALVLSVVVAANVMRTTRSEYVAVADADFVRTARGKGLRPRRIRMVHVLRNASVPIMTLTGIQFGYLLGGTIVIEQIFALPGMGRLLFTSISDRDYPVVQSAVLVIAALFVAINLFVDLLYRVIDPRTRES